MEKDLTRYEKEELAFFRIYNYEINKLINLKTTVDEIKTFIDELELPNRQTLVECEKSSKYKLFKTTYKPFATLKAFYIYIKVCNFDFDTTLIQQICKDYEDIFYKIYN